MVLKFTILGDFSRMCTIFIMHVRNGGYANALNHYIFKTFNIKWHFIVIVNPYHAWYSTFKYYTPKFLSTY